MQAAGGVFRFRWLAPLVFFQVYLTVVLLLFFWGPWPWDVQSPVRLGTYLVLAQVSIAVGYLGAWTTTVTNDAQVRSDANGAQERAVHFLRLAVAVTLVLAVPTSLSRTGLAVPDVMAGIANAGAVYNANFERLSQGNPYVATEYLRILLAPLLVGLLPLTVVYWSKLSTTLKFGCAVGVAVNLAMYVATGTNKGIADFAVTLPWLIALGVSLGSLRVAVSRRTIVLAMLLLIVAFLAFFGAGQAQREGGVGEFGVFNTGSSIIYANRESGLSVHLSDSQRIIYESLARYVGQGYYALALSMDLDHTTTWGFGHSMFLARNADTFFQTTQFTQGSLPGLLEERTGWGMMALWHSIYPWLASDFGFAGALVVLGGLAWLFALSWGRALQGAGHRWVILLYLLLVLFYYVPANNQVFQTAESATAFLVVLALVMLGRPASAPPQERGGLLRPQGGQTM